MEYKRYHSADHSILGFVGLLSDSKPQPNKKPTCSQCPVSRNMQT